MPGRLRWGTFEDCCASAVPLVMSSMAESGCQGLWSVGAARLHADVSAHAGEWACLLACLPLLQVSD